MGDSALSIVETANEYYVISKNYPEKSIYIGDRDKLASFLFDVNPDMIIATYGSSERCIIVLDHTLGQLMDLIAVKKKES